MQCGLRLITDLFYEGSNVWVIMRIKVTISLQVDEIRLIDRRRKELNMTRSSYLRSLAIKEIIKNQDKKKD
jgi:hypothetical protein